MKKIAIILQSFEGGGVEKVLINLANELSRTHHITILAMSHSGELKDELLSHIRVVNCNVKRAYKMAFPIKRFVTEENPDLIISAKHFLNLTTLITKKYLLKESTAKIMATVHGHIGSGLKEFVMKKLIKSVYPFSDVIICVSQGVLAEIIELSPDSKEKVKVIYNPVITPSFLKKADEIPSMLKEKDERWIVTIARLSQEKNIKLLIEAFHRAKIDELTKLYIIGDGPEREKLEELVNKFKIQEKVFFLGFLDNPYTYLKQADLFALTSNSEGLGNVLIEALYFNVPVISTDCKSGPREILKNGEYGMLVPVNDVEELSIGIKEILNNGMAQKRQDVDLTPYEQDKVLSNYLDVMKSIMN
ncbi:glycosyltransferase [Bacillus carboniphilus]|uniref:Glycosyltransferase n=1 Tax=Bacillus carboniphilus TaxID=86663 RepID=A0ABY9JRR2_9BACI|nr:glycosyltransferase [Bacillus carboniphilus]WLR41504.1 glycosyltransferase [Bacillus carboniphilus]